MNRSIENQANAFEKVAAQIGDDYPAEQAKYHTNNAQKAIANGDHWAAQSFLWRAEEFFARKGVRILRNGAIIIGGIVIIAIAASQ